MKRFKQYFQIILSFLLVAFGQPAWSWIISLIAAACGYAIFWNVIIANSDKKYRFWLSTLWFAAVQLIQLSWFISHPYLYIYAIWMLCSFLMGIQFGLLGLMITPANVARLPGQLAIAGTWIILEWSRLFWFSGLSWNPAGLALSANLYSLQAASFLGIFGMSFWVVWVNLLALKAWLQRSRVYPATLWAAMALMPYAYGFFHLSWHDSQFAKHPHFYTAVLVQTAFPIEESLGFRDRESLLGFVIKEWKQILTITRKQLSGTVDLLVLPEFVVPYGTYSFVFPYAKVENAFREIYGPESIKRFPKLEEPLAQEVATPKGPILMVNNAFWAQAIANVFSAEVVVGLEDAEDVAEGTREYYSSAIHFSPQSGAEKEFQAGRYEKRVLVPMGEYIPFEFCKKLAADYGISGSFTCGKEAKVFGSKLPLGLSICYEETFADIMRENKQAGAQMLVNLTSDVWYPNSRLPQQHFDHSRLRTVENGIPLVRACNTGITSAIDSLGRIIAVLGETPSQSEWISDSLKVVIPTYTYKTVYSMVGDKLIIALSFLFLGLFIFLHVIRP